MSIPPNDKALLLNGKNIKEADRTVKEKEVRTIRSG
jgi:hypothetical protein